MKISKQKLKQIIKEEISNFQNYLSEQNFVPEQNELQQYDTYNDIVTIWENFTKDEHIAWAEDVMDDIGYEILVLYERKEITTITQMVKAYAQLLEANKEKLWIQDSYEAVIKRWVEFLNNNLSRLQDRIEIE